MTQPGSIWQIVSQINGTISFCSAFISLFPQIIETFRDKTVEGLSPYFLLAWVGGDITSLIGAWMTKQLMFQVVLALYFLCNDLFVCGQYYYYGILHENKLATAGHESKPMYTSLPSSELANESDMHTAGVTGGNTRRNQKNFFSKMFALVGLAGSANALPLEQVISIMASQDPNSPVPIPGNGNNGNTSTVGITLSWLGAAFYVGARIPQLWKNYERKSTDGISPFLFATTLLANVTYNISILTSNEFLESPDRKAFLLNAMPFILGCTVTIFFDMVYFYQHYVLYAKDMQLRAFEREHEHHEHLSDENSPLL